ncbi:MAG TPA: phosphoribosylformylglycinamidine cyclo-ligase [Negativicutes bacterium]|nr:phosphoribosylformylglycinamidine cyclo-ligase [Negativicutes bacterium]
MDDKLTYKAAGVDVEAGYEAVRIMKQHTKRTMIPGVLGDLGSFGGFFELEKYNCKNPVLVSGTDGVGTKLEIAFMTGKHDTIGIDCVAMCVNDVACHGAKPLFFLDYIGTGKLEPHVAGDIVKGVCDGCVEAGCALIGGETAEMPGFYKVGEYDLAGFTVGIVDKEKVINGTKVSEGDTLIGIASSGIHSNGYSLVRKIFFGINRFDINTKFEELNCTLGEELLKPTRIYVKTIQSLMEKHQINGIAHITGGGFIENIPRTIPAGLKAEIELGSWEIPSVFKLMQKLGNIEEKEMLNTFNMGVGLVLAVSSDDVPGILKTLTELGEKAYVIGSVVKGEGGIGFCGR